MNNKAYLVNILVHVFGAPDAEAAANIASSLIQDRDDALSFLQFAVEDVEADDPLEEAVFMSAGPRCRSHEDGCPTCDLWREFDRRVAPRG